MGKRKKSKNEWVWEFSKRVVNVCALIYVIVIVYSLIVMAVSNDFSYLGTLISETSNILITGVFGYMVKAGVENAIKISDSKRNTTFNDI